ncbi:MAG: TIGR03084 family protein [Candidatus Tectomicrobia bacterium]|uniref:TIGR03084 family protein n=1 Tax=Tectimicrobiota bacterium TaxID=2528274 RepID=A0A932FXG3_UNCTE|nr:TIGR03084 family protein [Candidatus Tectomicrobia bacterium]
MKQICADLAAEHAALDEIVARLAPEQWDLATPAENWAIRDQIGHLAYFDARGRAAAEDPERFQREAQAALASLDRFAWESGERGRTLPAGELLAWWREERAAMLQAFERLTPRDRLPWYGPDMSALSFATARLMETWAHGQDIADTLGVRREATDRLRHVAHLGVTTFRWSYATRRRQAPQGTVRVELTSPSGQRWVWNEEAMENRVSGPAEEFCLVVTQRRHLADTALEVEGALAQEWMAIAQAYAGPPGPGRRPGKSA